jgi:ribosome-binding factor A
MTQKEEKIQEIIRDLVAQYFLRNSNHQSMITITNVKLLGGGGRAIISMTVIPETEEDNALKFARRQLTDLKKYVEDNSRLGRIPFLEIEIDSGEKNRQRIDEIERRIKKA